jgi:hypothetical protein
MQKFKKNYRPMLYIFWFVSWTIPPPPFGFVAFFGNLKTKPKYYVDDYSNFGSVIAVDLVFIMQNIQWGDQGGLARGSESSSSKEMLTSLNLIRIKLCFLRLKWKKARLIWLGCVSHLVLEQAFQSADFWSVWAASDHTGSTK